MPQDPVDDTGFRDEGDDFHLRPAGTQKRVHLEDLTEQARPGSPPRAAGVDFLLISLLLHPRRAAALAVEPRYRDPRPV